MSRFIELTDENYVTSAVNLDHVRCVTLIYAGTERSDDPRFTWGTPMVNVVFTDGQAWQHVLVPIADHPRDAHDIDAAVSNFFEKITAT